MKPRASPFYRQCRWKTAGKLDIRQEEFGINIPHSSDWRQCRECQWTPVAWSRIPCSCYGIEVVLDLYVYQKSSNVSCSLYVYSWEWFNQPPTPCKSPNAENARRAITVANIYTILNDDHNYKSQKKKETSTFIHKYPPHQVPWSWSYVSQHEVSSSPMMNSHSFVLPSPTHYTRH